MNKLHQIFENNLFFLFDIQSKSDVVIKFAETWNSRSTSFITYLFMNYLVIRTLDSIKTLQICFMAPGQSSEVEKELHQLLNNVITKMPKRNYHNLESKQAQNVHVWFTTN